MKNRQLIALAALTGILGACAGIQPRPYSGGPVEGRVITGNQLRQLGTGTAWDALRRGGVFLSMTETPAGRPLQLSSRGTAARVVSSPLVVVDGSLTSEYDVLRDIPVTSIEEIRILGSTAATVLYGTAAGNGAIVVRTRGAD